MNAIANARPGMMLKSFLQGSLAAAIALAPLAIAQAGLGQEAVQSETADETVWGQQASDPFSSDGGAAGLLDLMQQINRGPSQSWSEFRATQQENLNTAADAFRARQLQLLNGSPASPQTGIESSPASPLNNPLNPQPESGNGNLDLQSAEPELPYRALW